MTSDIIDSTYIHKIAVIMRAAIPDQSEQGLLFGYCNGITTTYQLYFAKQSTFVQYSPDQLPESIMHEIQQLHSSTFQEWEAFILSVNRSGMYNIAYHNDLNPMLYSSHALDLLAYVTYQIEPDSEYGRKTLQESIKAESFKNTLLYACYKNDLGLVKERLNGIKPATLNKKIPYYGTALHIACHHKNMAMVKLLVEAGADIFKQHQRQTPLELAYHGDDEALINYLAAVDPEANEELIRKKGLFLVGNSNNEQLIVDILNKGQDINKVQTQLNRLTPLHLMAYNERDVGIRTLVAHGADLELQEQYKRTPLHYACHFQKINGARALLECGANVNTANDLGETPLHTACKQGDAALVQLLLEHQANKNAAAKMIIYPDRTYLTETALQTAERYGHSSIVELLSV